MTMETNDTLAGYVGEQGVFYTSTGFDPNCTDTIGVIAGAVKQGIVCQTPDGMTPRGEFALGGAGVVPVNNVLYAAGQQPQSTPVEKIVEAPSVAVNNTDYRPPELGTVA